MLGQCKDSDAVSIAWNINHHPPAGLVQVEGLTKQNNAIENSEF